MIIIDLDKSCVIKWRLTDICNYHCSYCVRRDFIQEQSQLEKDFSECLFAIPDVIRIAKELNTINHKPIKIDLIGGEVSLFKNLGVLLESLYKTPEIEKINLTTNLSNSVEYYLSLNEIALRYNKKLSITASFHYEYVTLSNFIIKANQLNKVLDKNFKCETVITNKNSQVEDFITACNKINCQYMCEEDVLDPSKKGEKIRNYKVNNRYLVIMEDNTGIEFPTRNEVIKQFGKNGFTIDTTKAKCTRDNDYVYIEKNMAIPCHNKIPISEYKVSPIPQKCKIGECSLCGHMSIFY